MNYVRTLSALILIDVLTACGGQAELSGQNGSKSDDSNAGKGSAVSSSEPKDAGSGAGSDGVDGGGADERASGDGKLKGDDKAQDRGASSGSDATSVGVEGSGGVGDASVGGKPIDGSVSTLDIQDASGPSGNTEIEVVSAAPAPAPAAASQPAATATCPLVDGRVTGNWPVNGRDVPIVITGSGCNYTVSHSYQGVSWAGTLIFKPDGTGLSQVEQIEVSGCKHPFSATWVFTSPTSISYTALSQVTDCGYQQGQTFPFTLSR